MICVPITETTAAAFLAAIDEALPLADAIELRLDYLPPEELNDVLAALAARPELAAYALIFTFRPREQGGQRDLTLNDRIAFWRDLNPDLITLHTLVDLEIDLVEKLIAEGSPIPWDNIICSYHDFTGTPADLNPMLTRLKRTPARAVKIATLVRHPTDCLRLFEVVDRAGSRPVIALGMGMPGLPTRILAVSRGAMLTFGALRAGAESASGQPTVVELRELYHLKTLTRKSEIYGVVGYPIGHSLSPKMHNAAMMAAGRDAVYMPFEVEKNLEGFIRDMVHPRTRRLDWNIRGLSVTIPHKLEVMKYLDEVDPLAREIGAVNTIAVEAGRLCGYNTDITGAMKPLDAIFDVRGARVAVLGGGGAARAICHGLVKRGAAIKLYGRDVEKLKPLAEELDLLTAPLWSFTGVADVVVNCTPVGMHGHSEERSPLPRWSLDGVKLVYDLVYNPVETVLLRDARRMGCKMLGGGAMLEAQAAEQYRLWTGEESVNYAC
ncbi:MAG: shikimate dehydrogenase [Acidobacteriota bacterium]